MLENGLLNLTNWAGNVIMPTLAGLFFAAAIYRFSKAHPYSHLSWAGFAALMCSGLLRALEAFAQQAGPNDPDRYWISILTLVNWVGNVMLPLYGVILVTKRTTRCEVTAMALDVTSVNCTLHTRVTVMAREFEDLFVILGLAA